MAWRRRTLARATAAQIAATMYGLGEPIVNKDAGADLGRLAIGDGQTAGGRALAFKAELDALAAAPPNAHTHGTGDVVALAEYIRDTMAACLTEGPNVSLSVDDAGDTITIGAAGGSGAANVGAPINASISASAGAGNTLTLRLTSADGTALTNANKALIPMRSASPASGAMVYREVTADLTLTLSAGSTLGFVANRFGRLWLALFDDAGTPRLGVINCRQPGGEAVFPLPASGIASSTAEGGAGAADSAHVFYTGAAVVSKAYAVLGSVEWAAGLAAPGTWVSAPDRVTTVHGGMALPGTEVLVSSAAITGAVASVSLALPAGYASFRLAIRRLWSTVNSPGIVCLRASINNGGSWLSGAGDYTWSGGYWSGSSTSQWSSSGYYGDAIPIVSTELDTGGTTMLIAEIRIDPGGGNYPYLLGKAGIVRLGTAFTGQNTIAMVGAGNSRLTNIQLYQRSGGTFGAGAVELFGVTA